MRRPTGFLSSFLNRMNRMNEKGGRGLVRLLPLAVCLLFSSCYQRVEEPVIIWGERAELASYIELFNATHDMKAEFVYKDSVSRSLPPARDEQVPDIVIGSWLKTASIKKHFLTLETFFNLNKLPRDSFYANLLEYGTCNGQQYLFPVSFNLPAVVFDEDNAEFIADGHILTLGQIREADAAFSRVDDKGVYRMMGFAPSWDADFLYLVAKVMGTSFAEGGSTFTYDRDALLASVDYLKDWTLQNHTSYTDEQDFKFSYLYRPESKWLSEGRSLFTYMNSREFYTMDEDTDSGLSFRWVSGGKGIMLEDDIVCMGLYRKAKNRKKAEVFIEWFFREDTQKALMERYKGMSLDTKEFGIAGGFSSLKNVNGTLFPVFYHELLGNMPLEEQLILPDALPSRFDIFKDRIITPFLVENCQAEPPVEGREEKPRKSLDDYIADWSRQAF
jgi:ABC-type glycerol-3-phosphate transport system substrate-binding protein